MLFLLRAAGITIRERVGATPEIWSGANDPMTILLTMRLAELAAQGGGEALAAWLLLPGFGLQIGLGRLLGLLGGGFIVLLLRQLHNLEPGLHPIAALAGALVAFAAAGRLGGSGFLAACAAGLVAGDAKVRFATLTRRCQAGMTRLAQIGMFLTLGLLATPAEPCRSRTPRSRRS